MPDIEFLNVCVQADTVLSCFGAGFSPILGKRPTLGQKGLGADAPANWREVFLDSPAAQIWGRELGWDLRDDDPRSFLDHTWSYRNPGNWPLYRDFLAGALDDDHWAALKVWLPGQNTALP